MPKRQKYSIDIDVNSRRGVQQTRKLESGLKKLGTQATATGTKMKASTTSMAGGFGNLSTKMAGFAAAGATAMVALNRFAGAMKSTIDTMDLYAKQSARLGIAVSTLSSFRLATELTGTSMESLGKGLKRLAASLGSAGDGLKTASDVFERWGISVLDSNGNLRSLVPVLEDFAEAFSQSDDAVRKAADAQLIFGKSGLDMLPMLALGREGIQDLRDEADKMGLAIGPEMAAKAEAFNDQMTRLDLTLEGLRIELADEILPALTEFIVTLTEGLRLLNKYRDIVLAPGPMASIAEGIRKLDSDYFEALDVFEQRWMKKLSEKTEEVAKKLGLGPALSYLDILAEKLGLMNGATEEAVPGALGPSEGAASASTAGKGIQQIGTAAIETKAEVAKLVEEINKVHLSLDRVDAPFLRTKTERVAEWRKERGLGGTAGERFAKEHGLEGGMPEHMKPSGPSALDIPGGKTTIGGIVSGKGKAFLGNMTDQFGLLQQAVGATQQAFKSFISGQASFGSAMGQVFRQLIAGIAEWALTMSIQCAGLAILAGTGIGSVLTGGTPAQFAAAAVVFASIAGATAGVGAAIGPAKGGGFSPTGTALDPISVDSGPVPLSSVKLRNQAGAGLAVTLASIDRKLDSMSAGDVLVKGQDQNRTLTSRVAFSHNQL